MKKIDFWKQVDSGKIELVEKDIVKIDDVTYHVLSSERGNDVQLKEKVDVEENEPTEISRQGS